MHIKEKKKDELSLCKDEQKGIFGLYNATPNCDGYIYSNFYQGGGVKCTKCNAWFCF